jgi:hypothetical protein
VLARRLRATSTGHRAPAASARPRVLYIDCGMHKSGAEIRYVHRWFADRYDLNVLGVEAGSAHFREVSAALADLEGVRLRHVALVGPGHEGEEVRMYNHSSDGRDTILADGEGEYETVPARRLSDLLAEEGWSLQQTPAILRMSIVGAEKQVIEDLLDAGLTGCVDGYYGIWRSPAGTPEAREGFIELLRQAGVRKVTFNLKDLITMDEGLPTSRLGALAVRVYQGAFRLRRYAIRTDIETSLRLGIGRVQRAGGVARESSHRALSAD